MAGARRVLHTEAIEPYNIHCLLAAWPNAPLVTAAQAHHAYCISGAVERQSLVSSLLRLQNAARGVLLVPRMSFFLTSAVHIETTGRLRPESFMMRCAAKWSALPVGAQAGMLCTRLNIKVDLIKLCQWAASFRNVEQA